MPFTATGLFAGSTDSGAGTSLLAGVGQDLSLRGHRKCMGIAKRSRSRMPGKALTVLRKNLTVQAVAGEQFGGYDNWTPAPGVNRREFLLDYVEEVQPQAMEEFVVAAPSQVIDAMRHTITNMLGSLPPQFFDVRISTMGENLSQLMYSVMMTGYMFRNAQYRVELHRSLGLLPGVGEEGFARDGDYLSKAQKTKVQGEVVRWHQELGAESMSAVQYIEQLETEVDILRNQLDEQRKDTSQNDLLEYIKGLDGVSLQELTGGAGEDVLLAMNVFIQRLMGTSDATELQQTNCESTVLELARLLYWLMVVGYNLRTMEVRFEMERSLQLPAGGAAELPPSV